MAADPLVEAVARAALGPGVRWESIHPRFQDSFLLWAERALDAVFAYLARPDVEPRLIEAGWIYAPIDRRSLLGAALRAALAAARTEGT